MFGDSSYAVKTSPSTRTNFCRSSSGIFQGCVWSRLIFILFIDAISDELRSVDSHSPKLAERIIRHLLWADDLVLISKTILGLQRLLDTVKRFCDYWGLEVNTDKTNILVFGRGVRLAREEVWFYDGKKLNVQYTTRYLGFYFSSNNRWAQHRKIMVEKANRALYAITEFLFKNRNLPVKFFKYLFSTAIEPILLYGSEIWSVFPKQNTNPSYVPFHTEVDIPLLKFLRLALGVPKHTATSAVLLETGSIRTSCKALSRAIDYWVRLQRLPESHIMKHCLAEQISLMRAGNLGFITSQELHSPVALAICPCAKVVLTLCCSEQIFAKGSAILVSPY
jgi:hypothetical protein